MQKVKNFDRLTSNFWNFRGNFNFAQKGKSTVCGSPKILAKFLGQILIIKNEQYYAFLAANQIDRWNGLNLMGIDRFMNKM